MVEIGPKIRKGGFFKNINPLSDFNKVILKVLGQQNKSEDCISMMMMMMMMRKLTKNMRLHVGIENINIKIFSFYYYYYFLCKLLVGYFMGTIE